MKKQRRKKRGFIIFIVLFFAIFIALYSNSNKMLVKIGEASNNGMLSTASYYAIEQSFKDKYDYENFFKIHKDEQGEITMITADSYKFNNLTVSLANKVSECLTAYNNSGVDVPIGVFTGIGILQGVGSKVKMPLIAINSVRCDVVSSFESAGINQTRHTLYVDITSSVSIITKVITKNIEDKIKVMIYDNIIIGSVPETYLSGIVFSACKTS